MSPETKLRDKPALILVTDPELIEKLERLGGEMEDASLPRAGKFGPSWFAYATDMRRYRQTGHRNSSEAAHLNPLE